MGDEDDLIIGVDDDAETDVVVRDATTEKVIATVAEVLGVPHASISPETEAADLEEWDSFGHVRIVLAIDKAFGIRLSMEAIERADGVAGLVAAVEDAKGMAS